MSKVNADQKELDTQAKQITGLLDERASRLSMRTLKQLEIGRERALQAHTQRLAGGQVHADGTIGHFAAWVSHHRVASSGLLFAMLISAWFVLQPMGDNESSDALLLGSELPPEAFVDTGFAPSLNPSDHS
jgi:hypothetical protein